jgi:RNA methyltransferase, TrmH family
MHRNELVVCGLLAVRARFQRNPLSILRLFFDAPTARKIGFMCKALAVARKVYRCVDPAELELISGTVHHGGIVAVVTAPLLRAPLPEDLQRWVQARTPLLLLDRIGNAHNFGAIARTAAFFGVEHLVVPVSPAAALPGEAAYRVAEGGMEYVTVWRVERLAGLAKELDASGYEVVGAATRGGRADASHTGERPVALVLGNEEQGLTPDVASACTRLVTLPGSGHVESLNVSVASAVLMWEYFGRQRTPAVGKNGGGG